MARAAGSSDYKMEPRVGSGQCSQLSPDIRTAGTSEWSSGPRVVKQKAEKQNTYAEYAAVQNMGKSRHL